LAQDGYTIITTEPRNEIMSSLNNEDGILTWDLHDAKANSFAFQKRKRLNCHKSFTPKSEAAQYPE
jgi:hypothetical protein